MIKNNAIIILVFSYIVLLVVIGHLLIQKSARNDGSTLLSQRILEMAATFDDHGLDAAANAIFVHGLVGRVRENIPSDALLPIIHSVLESEFSEKRCVPMSSVELMLAVSLSESRFRPMIQRQIEHCSSHHVSFMMDYVFSDQQYIEMYSSDVRERCRLESSDSYVGRVCRQYGVLK